MSPQNAMRYSQLYFTLTSLVISRCRCQLPTSAPSSSSPCGTEAMDFGMCQNQRLTSTQRQACFQDCFLQSFPSTNNCTERQIEICPALDSCSECAPCREELRILTECFFQRNFTPPCLDFECPSLTLPPSLSPSNSLAPTSEPCMDQDFGVRSCLLENVSAGNRTRCMDCMTAVLPDSLPECSSLEAVCSDLADCETCFGCLEEVTSLVECRAKTLNPNCGVDCVTPSPTTPPTRAPACPQDLGVLNECFDRELTDFQEASCVECVQAANPNNTRCVILQDAYCPAVDACTICGNCMGEFREYVECFFLEAGCRNFNCSTVPPSLTPSFEPSRYPSMSPTENVPTTERPISNQLEEVGCEVEAIELDTCLNSRIASRDGMECRRCVVDSYPLNVRGCFSFFNLCSDLGRCSACGPCRPHVNDFLACRMGKQNCQFECQSSRASRIRSASLLWLSLYPIFLKQ